MDSKHKYRLALRLCGILLLPAAFPAAAQIGSPLQWAEKPVLHNLPDSLKKSPAVYILEERAWEMQENRNDYDMYRSRHFIVHLNDEKGVQTFNTFNIPIGSDRRLLNLKARSILKGGRVIELGREKIKQVRNEDGNPEYLLALEGLEPGSEVELLYAEQRAASTFGSETFQMGVPALEARLRLVVPEKLRFDSRGYNGFPAFRDSVAGGKRFYFASLSDIAALENESYSRFLANVQRIDYKLSYVGADDQVRKLTWSDLARKLYDEYMEFSGKELKAAGRLLAAAGVRDGGGNLEKVQAIENYMKSGIVISGAIDDAKADEFDRILERKTAARTGFLRLFTASLTAAGVPFELGLVANRYRFPLDEQLEFWDHLDEYMVYLPKEKTYLAPLAASYRHPVFPHGLGGSRGLFTRTIRLGSMSSAAPDIRDVPHSAMEDNKSSVVAEVRFDRGSMMPAVNVTNAYYGNSAGGMRPVFVYIDKGKEKQIVQEIVGLSDKPEDLGSYQVENAAFANYNAGKPLEISCSFTQAPRLMEKAGPKYLFRIGELIGHQDELYQDEKRVLPVELEFPHTLPRTIRIHIPEGYRVSNPEALRRKVLSPGPGDRYGFISDYRLEGGELVVDIREFYKEISYPVSEYGSYRRVVNAAADFNKVVLVLEKI